MLYSVELRDLEWVAKIRIVWLAPKLAGLLLLYNEDSILVDWKES